MVSFFLWNLLKHDGAAWLSSECLLHACTNTVTVVKSSRVLWNSGEEVEYDVCTKETNGKCTGRRPGWLSFTFTVKTFRDLLQSKMLPPHALPAAAKPATQSQHL